MQLIKANAEMLADVGAISSLAGCCPAQTTDTFSLLVRCVVVHHLNGLVHERIDGWDYFLRSRGICCLSRGQMGERVIQQIWGVSFSSRAGISSEPRSKSSCVRDVSSRWVEPSTSVVGGSSGLNSLEYISVWHPTSGVNICWAAPSFAHIDVAC